MIKCLSKYSGYFYKREKETYKQLSETDKKNIKRRYKGGETLRDLAIEYDKSVKQLRGVVKS